MDAGCETYEQRLVVGNIRVDVYMCKYIYTYSNITDPCL
jgi:hypothetical protein